MLTTLHPSHPPLIFLLSLSRTEREGGGTREGERASESIVKLEQDGNKEDGYSGPTLTHTSLGLNYTCVCVGVYRCGGEAIHPAIPRASRQAGRHQGELRGNAFTWDQHTLHA